MRGVERQRQHDSRRDGERAGREGGAGMGYHSPRGDPRTPGQSSIGATSRAHEHEALVAVQQVGLEPLAEAGRGGDGCEEGAQFVLERLATGVAALPAPVTRRQEHVFVAHRSSVPVVPASRRRCSPCMARCSSCLMAPSLRPMIDAISLLRRSCP